MANPTAPRSHEPHTANRLLAALPESEMRALLPFLTKVPLRRHDVLANENDEIEHIYFPHRGVVSLVVNMRGGQVAETTTVGPEGLVEFGAILGRGRAYASNVVQVSGESSRIDIRPFMHAMAEGTHLRRLVFLYLGAFVAQTLHSVACNALHVIEERTARWLLMAHDRARQDSFDLTQEYLAEMLGVRRASVNLIGRSFQQAGLIEYSRGVIRIIDRAGLENITCECYQSVRSLLDEVFAHP